MPNREPSHSGRGVVSARRRGIPAHRAAVILLLLSTTGCSAAVASQPLTPADGPPPATAAAGGAAAGFGLPVDAYQLSEPQRAAQLRATDLLLQACMARFGYAFPVPDVPQVGQVSENAFRYGPVTMDQAADGYLWMVDHGSTDRAEAQLSRAEQAMPSAESSVLLGRGAATASVSVSVSVSGERVPAGGCVGEMKRTISAGGGTYGNSDLVQAVDQGSYTESLSAPQVVAAFRAWSSCMAGQGYHYPTPLDPMRDDSLFAAPALRTGAPGAGQSQTPSGSSGPQQNPPSARQIAVARADVGCKARTNLVAVWSAVESGLQQQAIREHTPDFAALKRQLTVTVANIDAIVH